ncbi:MAG: P-II family nitrogen regulator, partial [Cyclobacteriaceae bacterium]
LGLKKEGFCCYTITTAEGTGNYTDPGTDFPSLKHPFSHSEVAKLEIVARDENVQSIVKTIHEHGKTGRRGDGLIYITPVLEAYRVRDFRTGKEIINHTNDKS